MTTPPPPAEPPHPQLAGPGTRLTAKLIDLAITAAIAFVALIFFGVMTLSLSPPNYTSLVDYPFAVPFLGVPLYEAAVIAATVRKGTTPGKKLFRIKVVNHSGSLTPSALRAIIRWALPLVATAPLVDAFIRDIPELAGYAPEPTLSERAWWVWVALGWWLLVQASALWDPRRRGWHDKAAGTIVIKAPRATM